VREEDDEDARLHTSTSLPPDLPPVSQYVFCGLGGQEPRSLCGEV